MELLLTDQQAQYLIKLFKTTLERHDIYLSEKSQGSIQLKSFENQYEFTLRYHFSIGKKTIHFMDDETKHTLFRVHLSDGFHKNANGERVYGNELMFFPKANIMQNKLWEIRLLTTSAIHYHMMLLMTLTIFLNYSITFASMQILKNKVK
ncbi:hypothetical protein ABW365_22045 [Enterococcus avium]